MKIENLNVESLKPYQRNARKNDKAVRYVKQSIRDFGFKVPILVDADNVVIAGHTRLKAAKALKLPTVPCIRVTDLTEDQVKAFRLADNKVAEVSEWDEDLLKIEVADIDFDLGSFGFGDEILKFQDGFEVGDILGGDGEQPETPPGIVDNVDDVMILNPGVVFKTANPLGIPELRPDMIADIDPDEAFFKREMNVGDCKLFRFGGDDYRGVPVNNGAVCFYTNDERFEVMWNKPDYVIEKLKMLGFKNAIGLDFTVFDNSPAACKVFEKYRSMWCNRMMQEAGIRVMPSVTAFSREGDFMRDYDLVGIPKNVPCMMVQVQTYVTDAKSKELLLHLRGGIERILDEISPQRIYMYGTKKTIEEKVIGYLPTFKGYRIVESYSAKYNKSKKKEA